MKTKVENRSVHLLVYSNITNISEVKRTRVLIANSTSVEIARYGLKQCVVLCIIKIPLGCFRPKPEIVPFLV